MGCFPVDFQEVKRPLRTKSVKRPIKVGKRPINEGKRPIKAKVLVGVSVGCLMGCFRAPPPWRKTAPLKRPIKRSIPFSVKTSDFIFPYNPHPRPSRQTPPGSPTPESLISVHFGSVWLRSGPFELRSAPFRVGFGSVSAVLDWGRCGVGCKGKEYH